MPVAADVILEAGVVLHHRDLVNLYGCRIGRDATIGPFVEIQRGVNVGARCKISSHSFLCEGVTLEEEVFVGHGVIFVNDRNPKAAVAGRLVSSADWTVVPTRVGRGASIGSGAIILSGVSVGANALIGAGAVVTHDVAAGAVVAGVPARLLRQARPSE
jgi:UDP-2-acetamido-3-amino-2,3-dideoxy-glucuronate N-acetyltransferase